MELSDRITKESWPTEDEDIQTLLEISKGTPMYRPTARLMNSVEGVFNTKNPALWIFHMLRVVYYIGSIQKQEKEHNTRMETSPKYRAKYDKMFERFKKRIENNPELYGRVIRLYERSVERRIFRDDEQQKIEG